MDWSIIILCFVFANAVPSHGDINSRRFSAQDFAKHFSHSPLTKRSLSRQAPLDVFKFPRVDRRKHSFNYRKSNDLPILLRTYLQRRLSKSDDKRRSTLSLHSEQAKERVLPPSQADKPGHTLIQPTNMMLKSAATYPRTKGLALVYGSQDNLGIVHGQTPYRVLYSDFRKANLMELLMNLLNEPNSVGSLRRSSNAKRKLREKNKSSKVLKSLKRSNKQFKKIKKSDTKRTRKRKKNHNKFKKPDSKRSRSRSNKKKTSSKTKKKNGHSSDIKLRTRSKIVDKLQDQLEQNLKKSNLKKKIKLTKISKKLQKKIPLFIRQHNSNKVSLKSSSGKKDKRSGYKKDKKRKRILRKLNKKHKASDKESESIEDVTSMKPENDKSDEIIKEDTKPKERLVYGSPDNYGIVWGKTPYRTVYTDFRRTTTLLGKILEAYHNYKREKNLKKALVAIKLWPLDKTKRNQEKLNNLHRQVLDNDPNEIMDDEPIDIDAVVLDPNEIIDDVSTDIDDEVEDFRKQRRKSHAEIKSAFRDRDDNYEKGNNTTCVDSSDEKLSSDESDYEKNPGNPYTLFKNKYKQNWPWHFELGDHINLNPHGPQFTNQGPSGASLFFNRKWWYFNQDDYIPFR